MKKTFSQKIKALQQEANKQWQKNYKEFQKTNNWDFYHIADRYADIEKQLNNILEDIQLYKDNSTLFEKLF